MLGTAAAPLRLGNAKVDPERQRQTAAIIERLQPILKELLAEYRANAVAEALGSWLFTMLIRGVGATKAAEIFTAMAKAAPTGEALDEARNTGSRA